MAAITQGDRIPRRAERDARPKPLGGLVMMLYPLLAAILPYSARKRLTERRDFTLAYHKRMREFEHLQKQVEKEARVYRQIIVERLAAMGFSWRTRRGSDPDPDEKARKRRRVVKVRIELTRFNEHAVYFKIHVRSRKLFGMRNELPYRVYVTEIVKDETCEELSFALQRRVTSKYDNPGRGAWLIVHRGEYAGLLPELVRFRTLLDLYPLDMSKGPILIGVGQNNTIHETTLDDCPHVLIGGASRSGKSNMLNCILSGLIRYTSPDDVRFILADPKKVELSFYSAAPHLDRPVIYSIDETIEMLADVNRIIDQRTDKMMGRAKQLSAFNRRFPSERMHRLIVVVEEMASLWNTTKEQARVQQLLMRIANMGRACGVNLILCTQLPVVDVIPSMLRVNFWLRIAGRVQNHHESRVILSASDAAYLDAVPGRMVYAKDAYVHHVQTPLIDDDDVRECIAISNGRRAGVIELHGHDPVIVSAGLCRLIAREFAGTIRAGELQVRARALGISAAMLKSWLDDLFAGRVKGYRANKVAGVYLLIDESRLHDAPKASPREAPRELYKRLPPPPVRLLLPAPAAPVPPEPAPAAVEPPPSRPEPRTEAEVFKRFLEERTVKDGTARTSPSALYAAFEQWCQGRFTPVSGTRFGMMLRDEGYESTRYRGERCWIGIRLDTADRVDMSTASTMSSAA